MLKKELACPLEPGAKGQFQDVTTHQNPWIGQPQSQGGFAEASSEESSLLVVELHFEKKNLGTEQMVLRRWYWPAVIIYCPPDTLVLFLQKLDKLLSNFAENVSAVNLLRDYNIERSL